MILLIYEFLKKKDPNEHIYKTETDSQTQKTNLCSKGKGRGGINGEFGINIYMLPHRKQKTNKDLLHSSGNYTQYFVIAYKGKESGKEIYTYVCIYV